MPSEPRLPGIEQEDVNQSITNIQFALRQISDQFGDHLSIEKFYELVTDNSRDMISLTKMDGTFLYVSPYCQELIGYTPHELLGTNGYDHFHPDDFRRIKKEARFKNKFLNIAQYRYKRKDGSYIWVETVNRLLIQNGKRGVFQSSTRDISARKEAQQKLEQSSAILESMMENTKDFIFALDLDFRFLYFNSAYRDIYLHRTKAEPVVGEEYIFSPQNGDLYKKIFRKVAEGDRITHEIQTKSADGSTVYFEGHFSPITDKHGRPIGSSAFLRDVTEIKSS